MARRFEVAGQTLEPSLVRGAGGLMVRLGEAGHMVALRRQDDGSHLLELDGHAQRVWIASAGDTVFIQLDGRAWSVRTLDPVVAAGAGHGGGAADTAAAPMPGTVLSVNVAPGDPVSRGQTLLVLESMKMETPIHAWRDGTVAEVHQNPGATFDRGAPLVTLAPAGAPPRLPGTPEDDTAMTDARDAAPAEAGAPESGAGEDAAQGAGAPDSSDPEPAGSAEPPEAGRAGGDAAPGDEED